MKKLLFALSILCLSLDSSAQAQVDVLDYINQYKDLAIAEMQRTGVPASIKLAQGIHETGAGKSVLVKKSNNHFGIKCKTGWNGEKVYHDDDERGECFRSYTESMDSYKDHSNFLKNSQRYAFLFKLDPHDYKAWAYGLKKAGYATNIRYSNILIKLIEEYNLQQYTLIALGEARPQEEVFVSNKPDESPMKATNAVARIPDVKPALKVNYPSGEFRINNTRVIYVKAGTPLLALAEEHGIGYARLLDFNDLEDTNELERDQLIYLQRKRKVGKSEFHVVEEGESLYDISQAEGIRLESLASLNQLKIYEQPAVGEKLNLQQGALSKPVLQQELTTDVAVQITNATTSDIYKTNDQLSVTTSRHIVQTKETLYSIAKKYGVNIEQIREWNRLAGTDLKIGQELVIIKN